VNFDLLAEYNPLPETAEKPATAKQTASKQAKTTQQNCARATASQKGSETMKPVRSS